MNDLLEFYQQQILQNFSTTPWLSELQKTAADDFVRLGFPDRHHEEWKYTALDAFFQQRFVIGRGNTEQGRPSGAPVEDEISIENGLLKTPLPPPAHEMLIMPLAQAIKDHSEKLKPYLAQILPHEHGFQAQNTAMLCNGLFIYLPAGVQVAKPLWLSHWQDREGQAVYLRHVIVAEPDSSLCLIEDYCGAAGCSYFTSTVTEIFASASAHVTHYKIQRESKASYHVGQTAIQQCAESQVESHLFSLGGKLVRSDTSIALQEPKAKCLLNGVYAPGEGQHMDHHTLVRHQVAECESRQDYKGILSGKSRAVFNGKVYVEQDAQQSRAEQQNKNLLLSAGAEIDTKPQLEIFADDVICSHGATVGQLDEDALFYLATRGIDGREASRYLIRAFMVENLRAVQPAALSDWLGQLLNEQLG